MNNNFSFVADQDSAIIDELQKLSLEVESRQSLICFMFERNIAQNENFKQYENSYKEFYFQYQQLKKTFEQTIIIPTLAKNDLPINNFSWNLDFNTSKVDVTFQ